MDNPLKIHFNPTYGLAICRPVGSFGADHAKQLLNFLFAFESSNPEPFNRLLDLTSVRDIQLSVPDLYEYARARREATAHLATFRTVIIAPDPSAEQVAIVYARLMEGSKIQVAIFRDPSSAADWLYVPEAVIQAELAKQT